MDAGITVVGSGQASAPPDVLRMSLAVGYIADDVATAVAEVAERTDAVMAALRAEGVDTSAIRTTEVEVSQHYREPGRPQTYGAAHLLTVTSRDLLGFGRLLNVAVEAAGDSLDLHAVRFDVGDKTALLTKARALAFRQARDKAEELAELAGRNLGAATGISETYNHHGFHEQALGAQAGFESEIHITPGDTKLEVSLEVHFTWS
ncbi:SIMPL domain-containing protein [Kribbella sp. NPDC004138]